MNSTGASTRAINSRQRVQTIALLAFLFGACLPGCIAFARVVIIGLQNTPLFNVERTRPFAGYATDPTLWVTASICTLTTALLLALVIISRRHHGTLKRGIVFGILGAFVASLNCYVLAI